MMGLNALSTSLWSGQGRQHTGGWAGIQKDLDRLIKIKANTNPISFRGKQQVLQQGYHPWPGPQLCRRRPGQPHAQPVQHQSEVHPCSKSGCPQTLELPQEKHSSPAASSHQSPPGGPGPAGGNEDMTKLQ